MQSKKSTSGGIESCILLTKPIKQFYIILVGKNASRVWTYSKRIVWIEMLPWKVLIILCFWLLLALCEEKKDSLRFPPILVLIFLFRQIYLMLKASSPQTIVRTASPKMQGETDLQRDSEGSISLGHLTKWSTELDLRKWTLADHLKPDLAEQNSNTMSYLNKSKYIFFKWLT